MYSSVDIDILTDCSHPHSQFRTFTSPWRETFSYHLYPPYSLSDLSNLPSNIRIFFLVWGGGGAAPRSLWDHRPMPSTVTVWSPNHWTARELVNTRIFNGTAEGVEREAMLGTCLWSMGCRVGHCWAANTFTFKQFITRVLWPQSEGVRKEMMEAKINLLDQSVATATPGRLVGSHPSQCISMWISETKPFVSGRVIDFFLPLCTLCAFFVCFVLSNFCDPTDGNPPGSSVHGILQARLLEWVAILFSSGSSWPRDWTQVSPIAGRFFTIWATREAPM